MIKNFLLITVFFLHMFSLKADIRDLNKLRNDFIVETKKIEIPDFPEAFNPSIVRWNNKLLMCFRSYDPETHSTDSIWFVWLDDEFNPIGDPVVLNRTNEFASNPLQAKDPRLIIVGNQLYVIYSNLYPFEEPVSRMYVGKVEIKEDGSFNTDSPAPLIFYEGEIRNRKEKNWVPFVFGDVLMLAYSIQPHHIVVPILNPKSSIFESEKTCCMTLANTIGSIKWDWGQLRGGTPALFVNGSYLAFFHSDKAMSTVQSEEVMMNHYFMGAYTFQAEYPFAITGLSHYPIVHKTFYEGPMYKTWKPLRVVFPSGFIVEGDDIWLLYGRQDHEVWVAKIDKTKLLLSLKPVQKLIPKSNY